MDKEQSGTATERRKPSHPAARQPGSSGGTGTEFSGENAFTLIELMIVVALLGILSIAGYLWMVSSIRSARDITAKHDLLTFVQFEENYYLENGSLDLDAFPGSDDVIISTVSGSVDDPYNTDTPLVVESRHYKSSTVFEFNFVTRETIQR